MKELKKNVMVKNWTYLSKVGKHVEQEDLLL
jgi:hypothetical protein